MSLGYMQQLYESPLNSYLYGFQPVTYRDFHKESQKPGGLTFPFCSNQWHAVNPNYIVGVEHLDPADCGRCLEVCGDNTCAHVLVVDSGGKGLNLSKKVANLIFEGKEKEYPYAMWRPVQSWYCSQLGILKDPVEYKTEKWREPAEDLTKDSPHSDSSSSSSEEDEDMDIKELEHTKEGLKSGGIKNAVVLSGAPRKGAGKKVKQTINDLDEYDDPYEEMQQAIGENKAANGAVPQASTNGKVSTGEGKKGDLIKEKAAVAVSPKIAKDVKKAKALVKEETRDELKEARPGKEEEEEEDEDYEEDGSDYETDTDDEEELKKRSLVKRDPKFLNVNWIPAPPLEELVPLGEQQLPHLLVKRDQPSESSDKEPVERPDKPILKQEKKESLSAKEVKEQGWKAHLEEDAKKKKQLTSAKEQFEKDEAARNPALAGIGKESFLSEPKKMPLPRSRRGVLSSTRPSPPRSTPSAEPSKKKSKPADPFSDKRPSEKKLDGKTIIKPSTPAPQPLERPNAKSAIAASPLRDSSALANDLKEQARAEEEREKSLAAEAAAAELLRTQEAERQAAAAAAAEAEERARQEEANKPKPISRTKMESAESKLEARPHPIETRQEEILKKEKPANSAARPVNKARPVTLADPTAQQLRGKKGLKKEVLGFEGELRAMNLLAQPKEEASKTKDVKGASSSNSSKEENRSEKKADGEKKEKAASTRGANASRETTKASGKSDEKKGSEKKASSTKSLNSSRETNKASGNKSESDKKDNDKKDNDKKASSTRSSNQAKETNKSSVSSSDKKSEDKKSDEKKKEPTKVDAKKDKSSDKKSTAAQKLASAAAADLRSDDNSDSDNEFLLTKAPSKEEFYEEDSEDEEEVKPVSKTEEKKNKKADKAKKVKDGQDASKVAEVSVQKEKNAFVSEDAKKVKGGKKAESDSEGKSEIKKSEDKKDDKKSEDKKDDKKESEVIKKSKDVKLSNEIKELKEEKPAAKDSKTLSSKTKDAEEKAKSKATEDSSKSKKKVEPVVVVTPNKKAEEFKTDKKAAFGKLKTVLEDKVAEKTFDDSSSGSDSDRAVVLPTPDARKQEKVLKKVIEHVADKDVVGKMIEEKKKTDQKEADKVEKKTDQKEVEKKESDKKADDKSDKSAKSDSESSSEKESSEEDEEASTDRHESESSGFSSPSSESSDFSDSDSDSEDDSDSESTFTSRILPRGLSLTLHRRATPTTPKKNETASASASAVPRVNIINSNDDPSNDGFKEYSFKVSSDESMVYNEGNASPLSGKTSRLDKRPLKDRLKNFTIEPMRRRKRSLDSDNGVKYTHADSTDDAISPHAVPGNKAIVSSEAFNQNTVLDDDIDFPTAWPKSIREKARGMKNWAKKFEGMYNTPGGAGWSEASPGQAYSSGRTSQDGEETTWEKTSAPAGEEEEECDGEGEGECKKEQGKKGTVYTAKVEKAY